MLRQKSPNICDSFFTSWGTLRLSLLPSMKTMIPQSRLSTTVNPLIAHIMWKSDILHFSIGDSWRTSFWFAFLESWILRTCSRKHSVGYSTIVMPPTSWGTVAILAGKLSWFYFQLLSPPRQCERVLLNFIFDDICWFYFEIFGLALSFQLWCAIFCIRGGCERASCATYGRGPYTLHHERLFTDEARSWMMQRHWDDLKRIAQQELTLSTFHTIRSLIRLVFITSHLVYHSTMTSLDL